MPINLSRIALVCMLGAAGGTIGRADDPAIQSFEGSGRLVFNAVTGATNYEVRTRAVLTGDWMAVGNVIPTAAPTLTTSVSFAGAAGFYHVVAVAGVAAPSVLVLIPADGFVMGATTNVGHENISFAMPQHTVQVSAFYMDTYEVTSNRWGAVYAWAMTNGYAFVHQGSARASDHPIQMVSWHDTLAWCNARSQKEGFTPCYVNAGGTFYTNSTFPFAGSCTWTANGYRLPTEAEWEKAARGGVSNHRFPWVEVDTIQHARANYFSMTNTFSYDTSPTPGYHPGGGGTDPRTMAVGSFMPNGYGLYDLAGNVLEWCWDWYGSTYYQTSPGIDPRGPASGTYRVTRGGSWADVPSFARAAARITVDPELTYGYVGFRCVRGL